jgi:sugar phosphate isomerase/epimerase
MWVNGLGRILPLAADAGMTVSVENFPGAASPMVTSDDYLAMQNELPDPGLALDSGNLTTGGDTAIRALRRCAPNVRHVHLKDFCRSDTPREGYQRMLDGLWYRDALPGAGIADVARFLRELCSIGYTGCVDLEYLGADIEPEKALLAMVSYVRKVLATQEECDE